MTNLEKRYAIFCDANGTELMGTDSLIWIDRRYGVRRRDLSASVVRDMYKTHFPHKYAEMTHYKWQGQVRPVPAL